MRFFLKLVLAFIIKFRGVIIFGIIMGCALSIFLIKKLPSINLKTTVNIGYTGRYTIDELPYEISSLISRGLVKSEASGEIYGDLAESWSIEDNGKRWVFRLKDNVYWQDRKKFSVNDTNYNFQDVAIEKSGNAIIFNLNEPYIPFIVLLEKPIFKKGLLGTGEWKVKNLSLKGGYIQKITLSEGSETQNIKFYPTEEQLKFAFKMGEVSIAKNLSSPIPFEKWDDTKVEKNVKNNQVVVIFFNTGDTFLADKNFRLALNYSIDKSVFESRALSPINPESYFYNPQVKSYDFDLEKARSLLKDIQDKLPNDYVIKLISSPNLIDTAENVSKMWRDLGINSNVLVSSVIPSDYQAFITVFDIPKDPDQYSLWHSTQTQTNITKYKNLRIDKLLEEGRVEMDREDRKKTYLDFQRYLLEDSPAIFLFHPIWYNIFRN